MSFFKCKMCGGTIEFEQGSTIGVCDHCGTKQTLPRLDDDRKINLFDRANHFRRNNDFDKAMGIYEQILNEDSTDAEAYWSIVLCRYGIEYVEDPVSHKRVPTINRTQFSSVFADEDYKSAIAYADTYQKVIYEEEAKAIDEIQKGILSMAQKEEPFDIFICYKDTDENGRRTLDSVLANDLYHQLIQEGFKVFFSRITLEDKLGIAYEPYIFAALNSSKVMVVIGTKPEYFNAVWVKNEWSRYLTLIKNGAKKTLIPAFRDMNPYDLPDEFSHLQALDMSKLGFMQDLIRGIKKIVSSDIKRSVPKETTAANSMPGTASLLERAFLFLEDGKWKEADEYCEKVLDIEPRNPEAYFGKLMAEQQVKHREHLAKAKESFADSDNYRKVIRFGDEKLKKELFAYIEQINERKEKAITESIYATAVKAMASARFEDDYKNSACAFKRIRGYRNADALAEECLEKAETCRKDNIYGLASLLMDDESIQSYERATEMFHSISGWRDADDLASICQRQIEKIEARIEAERQETERKIEEDRIAALKKAKRKKTSISIAVASIIVFTAYMIIRVKVIIPKQKYNNAMELKDEGSYEEAIEVFEELKGYKDSEEQITACQTAIKERKYNEAIQLRDEGSYEVAIDEFVSLNGYRDSKEQIVVCQTAILDLKYEKAVRLRNTGRYEEAISEFEELDGYKDSEEQITGCKTDILDFQYNEAVSLGDAGQYEEAIEKFKALNGYKDSDDQIEKCTNAINDKAYNEALALYQEGNFAEAMAAFRALNGYKDSAEKAIEIYYLYETECLKSAQVGDIVVFGTYEQDNSVNNGKEEIEWIVLDKQDGRILVISRYILDCQKYNTSRSDVTWETCSLRAWLNDSFLNAAFTSEEQAKIQSTTISADKNPQFKTRAGNSTKDKVFLLSIAEAGKYFPSDAKRMCGATTYALSRGLETKAEYHTPDGKLSCWWWLRSPGEDQHSAANVFRDGLFDYEGDNVDYTADGVRPVMWIKVNE